VTRRAVVAVDPDGHAHVIGPAASETTLDQIRATVLARGWTVTSTAAAYHSWANFRESTGQAAARVREPDPPERRAQIRRGGVAVDTVDPGDIL
jgi:hypothetical protein